MKVKPADFRRFLASPDSGCRAALLYGPNRSAVTEAGRALVRWALGPDYDPLSLAQLNEDDLRRDKARLADELAAQSLLGGPRLVLVRIEGEAAAESLLAAVAAFEAGETAAAFLVVEAGDLGRSKLRTAFENGAHVAALPFYEDSGADLKRFAFDMLRDAGLTLSRDAALQLEALLPDDRGVLRQEIEKLILFAGPQHQAPEASDIAALLADEADAAVDAAAGAALQGEGAAAAQALSDLSGLQGISALKSLERRLLRLLEARRLMEGGLSVAEVGDKLRPPVFWKEKEAFAQQVRRWSPSGLTGALDMVWKAQLRAMTAGAPQELIAAATFRAVAARAGRQN